MRILDIDSEEYLTQGTILKEGGRQDTEQEDGKILDITQDDKNQTGGPKKMGRSCQTTRHEDSTTL